MEFDQTTVIYLIRFNYLYFNCLSKELYDVSECC